ncbi:high-affinity choline transporter 1-like [Hyla sarda]|uniref:high-affinity choline transporter 1-like n=1 Tax=Hyla sarda TaxID=327740 RepID=UPI0024C2D7E6|nr:high-affinity choline transporter 1-like [Hyla sarda]
MALNIPALLSILLFYALTLGIGVWASRKSKKLQKNGNRMEVAIVGGRKVNMVVGLFTTTATWVGGAYINGSAEVVYLPGRGLAWLQAPVGFAMGLIIGAIFFVTPMRSKKYLTMMDPLQEAYGNSMTCLLFIPALIADVCWFAAILASLVKSSAVSVIMDIHNYLSILISACIVITYTLFGGLYSVAYTDVIQLVFMVLGLWICIPFALLNSASVNIADTAVQEVFQEPWLGKIDIQYIGIWIDDVLYLGLGSIAWQIYFQRVLSASTTTQAKVTSALGAVGCVVLAIPSVLVGAVAASTDWNQTSYGLPTPYDRGEASMILPIVLQHLCPLYVSVAGLGAVAAAVMSSADSALLSSSSMFGYNIYKKILRKMASEKEVMVAMRVSTIVLGSTAAGMAFLSNSIYDLWFMCGEMVYAVVFPQLCCVLFVPRMNTYGSAAGFLVGLILRILGGVHSINIPPIIHYPWCTLINGAYIQLFPFKTFTMLVALGTQILVSYVSEFLFKKSLLPKQWDVCNVRKAEDVTRSTREELETFPLQDRSNNECK